jgi:hypothetical protein
MKTQFGFGGNMIYGIIFTICLLFIGFGIGVRHGYSLGYRHGESAGKIYGLIEAMRRFTERGSIQNEEDAKS